MGSSNFNQITSLSNPDQKDVKDSVFSDQETSLSHSENDVDKNSDTNPVVSDQECRNSSPRTPTESEIEGKIEQEPEQSIVEEDKNPSVSANLPIRVEEFEADNGGQEDERSPVSAGLTIKIDNGVHGTESEDEPRTPTSPEHRIQEIMTCPPAPRKPRSSPTAMKRKTPACCGRILVGFMEGIGEVEMVPGIMAGEVGAGERVKKVKKANVSATGS